LRVIGLQHREDIERFFEEIRNISRTAFENDGTCVPVAVFLLDEGVRVLPLQEALQDKDRASALLNALIDELRPLAFVLVVEAWIAMADWESGHGEDLNEKYRGSLTEADADGKRTPKEGVREVVLQQCSSVAGENFSLVAEIVRPDQGKPVLRPWERMDNEGAEGRLVFNVVPLTERQ